MSQHSGSPNAAALAPVPPARTIARPALDALLEEASARRLTIVCAGPGWGKTIAAARWLATRPRTSDPVAWATMKPQLDDPVSFWEQIRASLRASGGIPADHPLFAWSASAGMSEQELASVRRAVDSLPDDVLLVLDDLHHVTDPAVLESVAWLVERATRVRVMVLTRVVPALPRHRLRLVGELTEITAERLAFSTDEVMHVARTESVDLTEAQAEHLVARTEGWPAGVRLALMRAAQRGAGALDTFTGSDRSVAEYLLAEVLDRNSPQVRDFLMRTCVAQPLCAELAADIVPGASGQRILEMLEERNEFVSALGPDRAWFRYHPLLRDMLEHALRRDDPAGHRDAHRGAARWWAAHGDPIQGLHHATQASDWELFGALYTTAAGPALVGGRREALHKCLSQVPVDAAGGGVEAELLLAGLALLEERGQAFQSHVAGAQALLAHGEPAPAGSRVLADLLLAVGHWFIGEPTGVVEATTRAIASLDSSHPFPAAPDYRLLAEASRGIGHLWSGDLPAAAAMLTSLAGRTSTGGIDLGQVGARSHLVLTHAMQGRLDEVDPAVQEILGYARQRGWDAVFQVRPAHLAQALVFLLRGDLIEADSAIAAGLAAVQGGAEPTSTLLLHCLQAEVAVSRGRIRAAHGAARLIVAAVRMWHPPGFLPDAVEHAVTDVDLAFPGDAALPSEAARSRPSDTPMRVACRSRRLLAAGDHAAARSLAAPVAGLADPENVLDLVAVVEACLVTALAEDLDWRSPAADAAVRNALDLAGPHRIARPFLTTGSPRTAGLLSRVLEDGEDPFVAGLIGRLAGSGPATAEPKPLLEPLTERELAMLSALPTMKTNSEIAADFYVSVNTVKAHLKGLYRKLGVSSRRGAVERARDLGLLR